MSPLLSVEGLSVQFRVRDGGGRRMTLRAVDDVSFRIDPGETLGLIGESGCGKTSLVRAILGLQRAAGGRAMLAGENVLKASTRRRRAIAGRMQIVFQDPRSALNPRLTAHELVAEPLRIHGCYDPARVRMLLDQVGLPPDSDARRPADFSGGQLQRIGIARALAIEPDLLVLDEPVSALDVSVQAQVMNLLVRLQREMGLAYLFIAHDLAVVRRLSRRIAVMYLGRIVETGPGETVFAAPRHPYTACLVDSAPSLRRRGTPRMAPLSEPLDPIHRPQGCAFSTRCPVARDRCAVDDPPLRDIAEGVAVACWFPVSHT